VHPGYQDPAAVYVYDLEREWEMETLGDARLFGLLERLDIRLISYHQLGEVVAELRREQGLDLFSRLERLLE
jgi:hypothetical protein